MKSKIIKCLKDICETRIMSRFYELYVIWIVFITFCENYFDKTVQSVFGLDIFKFFFP